MDKFVCAFRGRRDGYQVPMALAEAGKLERFITDAYAGPMLRAAAPLFPNRMRAKVQFRHADGIPDNRVSCLWGITAIEHLRHRLGYSRPLTFATLNQNFSRTAAHFASRNKSNLFLYSPYAWEAFTASYRHVPRKVLFQYHPHPILEQRIFVEDSERHPNFYKSSVERIAPLPELLERRERDCWRHADLIFCASRFTQHSLLEVGCDERRCCVVPYGIDMPVAIGDGTPPDSFQVVFVGSGVKRKGLHHLLLAWQKASLPKASKLTLVCRVIDSEIERLAAATPNVEIIRGVSQQQLTRLYSSSCLFAMPSLVEGFGQVYLESLAQGCPVLGTPNTCLPDLGGEQEGVFLVSPGNIDELLEKLEGLGKILPNNHKIRMAARDCAAKFTWPAFRERIIKEIGGLCP